MGKHLIHNRTKEQLAFINMLPKVKGLSRGAGEGLGSSLPFADISLPIPPGMAIAINWTFRHCHTSTPTGGRGATGYARCQNPKPGTKPTGQAEEECSVQVGFLLSRLPSLCSALKLP